MSERKGDLVQSRCIPKIVYSTFTRNDWLPFLENQIVFANTMSSNNHSEVMRWCSENFTGMFVYLDGRIMCENHSDMVGAKTRFHGYEFG